MRLFFPFIYFVGVNRQHLAINLRGRKRCRENKTAPEGAKSGGAERRQSYRALSITKLHIYTLHWKAEYSRNVTFGKEKLHFFHKSALLAQIKRSYIGITLLTALQVIN